MGTKRIHDLARGLSREAFVKKFTSYFLVITDHGDDEPPSSFETVDASSAPRALLQAGPTIEVHEVAKGKDSPYQDRISLGRALNCDVVVRYASVSKLHGYFQPRPDGALDLTDVGSQIGTRVNGRALEPNKPERVAAGHILLIGRVAARLCEAKTVWDLLKAQERLSEPPSSPPPPRSSGPGGAPKG